MTTIITMVYFNCYFNCWNKFFLSGVYVLWDIKKKKYHFYFNMRDLLKMTSRN